MLDTEDCTAITISSLIWLPSTRRPTTLNPTLNPIYVVNVSNYQGARFIALASMRIDGMSSVSSRNNNFITFSVMDRGFTNLKSLLTADRVKPFKYFQHTYEAPSAEMLRTIQLWNYASTPLSKKVANLFS